MASITQPIDISQFSEDAETRRSEIAKRAAPSATKPILPEAYEKELVPVDAKTAECYSEMEELSYRWFQLANQLRNLL